MTKFDDFRSLLRAAQHRAALKMVLDKVETLDGEEWREIDGVLVSSEGRFITLGLRLCGSEELTPTSTYAYVTTCQGQELAHRLVCRAFHGEAPAGLPLARHLNDDPRDNRAKNLRWGDSRDNFRDRMRNATPNSRWSSFFVATSYDAEEQSLAEKFSEIDAAIERTYGTAKDPAADFIDLSKRGALRPVDFGLYECISDLDPED